MISQTISPPDFVASWALGSAFMILPIALVDGRFVGDFDGHGQAFAFGSDR